MTQCSVPDYLKVQRHSILHFFKKRKSSQKMTIGSVAVYFLAKFKLASPFSESISLQLMLYSYDKIWCINKGKQRNTKLYAMKIPHVLVKEFKKRFGSGNFIKIRLLLPLGSKYSGTHKVLKCSRIISCIFLCPTHWKAN